MSVKQAQAKEDQKNQNSPRKAQVKQSEAQKAGQATNLYFHQPIGTSEMDQLFSSRDRLRDFAEKIGHIKFTNIRKDVVTHCNKIKFNGGNSLTYESVEKMVKNRIEKMIKNKRIKKNWSEEDVKILIWIVSKYAEHRDVHLIDKELDSNDWTYIASLIPGVQNEHCMFKWLSLKKNNLSDNNWSDKESNLLDRIVKKYGDKDWALISQQLYYTNSSANKTYRCPKQCREHWNCYLNPKLKKGPWSKAEDLLLLNTVKDNNGSKKWAEMIELFNGRTENALKNRFTLIMQKEAKISPKPEEATELDLINQYLERTYVEQFVCKSNEEECQSSKPNKIKQKKEDPKREVRFSLRKRECFSGADNKKVFKNSLPYYQPRKHVKKRATPKKVEKVKDRMDEEIDYIVPIRDEISEPERNCWLDEENKIFEEESYISPAATSSRIPEEMPDLTKVRIVELNQEQFEHLKLTMLENSSDFVPCIIAENKLTKINY